MRRILLIVGAVFLVFFFAGWSFLLGEKVNCTTLTIDDLEIEQAGCAYSADLEDGMAIKVVNLRRYYYLFNRYLLVDLVQSDKGRNKHYVYLALVFNDSVGIQVHLNNSRGMSTDPTGKTENLSLAEFKSWLDKNDFHNKQVVALLYTKPGEKIQYLAGITVYKGDVKTD